MFAEYLKRARDGEIIHLKSPKQFSPIFELFTKLLREDNNNYHNPNNNDKQNTNSSTTSFTEYFKETNFDDFKSRLYKMIEHLNQTKRHYELFANILKDEIDCNLEGFLDIDFEKSYRLFHSSSLRQNYGYYIHRDSWFDLDPKGVNFTIYMTDVPYYANTQFFVDYFGTDIKYELGTRKILSPVLLDKVISYNCKERDVIIFCGDQLHGGAELEIPRFTIEFRLSQSLDFGRPDENILYKKIEQFLKS